MGKIVAIGGGENGITIQNTKQDLLTKKSLN